MTVLSNTFVIPEGLPSPCFSSGASWKPAYQLLGPTNLTIGLKGMRKSSYQKRALIIRANYSDKARPSSANMFIGGFVLGGLIFGTLSCVYAPQINNALTGRDTRDLMRKLPKFIYDEEKALERQRKELSKKIEQLNSAIDSMSIQLCSEEPPDELAASAEDIEAHA